MSDLKLPVNTRPGRSPRHGSPGLKEPGVKVSVYFPEHVIRHVVSESERLDRSISWVVQRCIKSGGLEAVQAVESDAEAPE